MSECMNTLRTICQEASPGPWENQDSHTDHNHGAIGVGHKHIALCNFYNAREDDRRVTRQEQIANTAFIVTARTTLPLLLDLCEALEWERECRSLPIFAMRIWPDGMNEYMRIQDAATAAVEAAKKALNEVCHDHA